MRNVIEEESTAIGGNPVESESSVCKIERINRNTNRNNYLTAQSESKRYLKRIHRGYRITDFNIAGRQYYLFNRKKENERPISYLHDEDVNEIVIKFRGQIPIFLENKNNKQKMRLIITEKDDLILLFGVDWMKKLNLENRNIRLDKNNQSEKRRE